ncbi:PREDICTED: poly(A) RNA polymerase, mitochondrial-like isoform X2 [Priapulus caudatus]|nr:PREDICTED: poly(A) RNA polymerase, mitochondrial-like isoform X2 [Priapulus caudatus]
MEFDSRWSVSQLVKTGKHFTRSEVIPVRSRMFYYLPVNQTISKLSQNIDVESVLTEDQLQNKLIEATSISEQMQILYEGTRLTELGTRLRYFVASLLEDSLSGMFPNIKAEPFGSSFSGFGKRKCDLDMMLTFEDLTQNVRKAGPLLFLSKKCMQNDRLQTQRTLGTLGDVLQYLMPGCLNVHRILHARVPIVKFKHEILEIDCDLSMSTNRSGVDMTQLLYIFGEIDPQLRPLVFTIRTWARLNKITNPIPGRWVSNFALTLLAIFFMQKRNGTVLPSGEKVLQEVAKSRRTGANLNIVRKDCAMDNLGDLLHEFYSFYQNFPFDVSALSIINADTLKKPDFSPLHIENCIDADLNVTKNVSSEELDRMMSGIRSALWQLECGSERKSNKNWGILRLFELDNSTGASGVSSFQVKTLFAPKGQHAASNKGQLITEDGDQSSQQDIESDTVAVKHAEDRETQRVDPMQRHGETFATDACVGGDEVPIRASVDIGNMKSVVQPTADDLNSRVRVKQKRASSPWKKDLW